MEPPTDAEPDRNLLQRGRRLVGASVLIAVIAGAMVVAWGDYFGRPARAHDIMLLYVGAEDCAPCRAWQMGDGASFLASAEFHRVRYREVKSPHLADVLADENWPDELRSYRGELKRSDGVPLWLVVSDHEIVERKFGTAAWRESILPRIRSLLRQASI
ncbi:hypothetical protein [Bradyrhizobium sp. CCBAU 53338]|uniref:hypothetical protein n=1 Tax=Bradyrhizobium sp. CCBAU 53338 TaxID=1325111 RepID=UPI00188A8782|nr:hypothetical protein [Bradyrhizobium sp. CCBAU 53338]QOZ51765.1 hypothetical protein XH90_10540 [Bradyrhizobium sp. CCBAU 53338]